MSEVKQEGDFSLKGKAKKPKQLSNTEQATVKVSIKEPLVDVPDAITKVVIPKDELNQDPNAVQTQKTDDSNAVIEESKNSADSEGVAQEVRKPEEEINSPIQLIEVDDDDTLQQMINCKKATRRTHKQVAEQRVLPENILKSLLLLWKKQVGQ